MIVVDGDWIGQAIVGALITVAGAFGLRHAAKLRTAAHRMRATPLSSALGAAPGKVRMRGRIESKETMVSPFSKTPCYYYRVEVEVSSDEAASEVLAATRFHTEVSPHRFSLRTTPVPSPSPLKIWRSKFRSLSIGKSSPNRATHRNKCWWTSSGALRRPAECLCAQDRERRFSHPEILADPRVKEKLKQREARHKELLQKKTKNQSFRFRETCLRPGQQYEVVGTLVVDGTQRVVGKGRDENWPFVVSSLAGKLLDQKRMQQARAFRRWSTGALILGPLMCLSSFWH